MITNKTAFDNIEHVIVVDEGGWKYTNDPDDPDQGTYGGMTYQTYAAWLMKKNKWQIQQYFPQQFMEDARAGKEEFKQSIRDCYYNTFYPPFYLDTIWPNIELPLLSGVINSPYIAVRGLQRAANSYSDIGQFVPLLIDGAFGQKTLSAVNIACDKAATDFIERYIDFWQEEFIIETVKRPYKLKWLLGWYRRAGRYRREW